PHLHSHRHPTRDRGQPARPDHLARPGLRRARLRHRRRHRPVGVSGDQRQRPAGVAFPRRRRHRLSAGRRVERRPHLTTTATDSAALRVQLVDRLIADGFLHEPRWQKAFLTIPREAFVDRFIVHDPATGQHTHYDLTGDREAALAAVYSNVSLLTQLDAGGTATSSSTTPSLMALMLERLDLHPGHRVL